MSHAAIGLTVYGSLIVLMVTVIVSALWLLGREDQAPVAGLAEVRSWPQAGGWHEQVGDLAEAWAAPVSARERLQAEAAETRRLIDRAAALLDAC